MLLVLYLCLAGFATSLWALAQEQKTPETETLAQELPEAQDPAPEDPAEPPRVVGQAGSVEEMEAFKSILAQTGPDPKLSKGLEFLEAFPNSGLTPLVHSEMAMAYRLQKDIDGFLRHGEEALKEMPDLPDLLATMAFFYSEKRQPVKATESANRALALLGTMEKPAQLTASDWAGQRFLLSGEAHYALGRVRLGQAQQADTTGNEDPTLREAVKHFRQTLEANPTHRYGAFRLAEAYQRQGDMHSSAKLYARTIAMGGSVGPYARERLEEIYATTYALPAQEALLTSEKREIEKAQEERRQVLAQIEAESAPPESTERSDSPPETTEPPAVAPPTPPQETGGPARPR